MDDWKSAQVAWAPAQTFVCTVCLIDKEEKSVVIDSNKVCINCVEDLILPRFHEAVKYEINHPVEWSTGIFLNPRDFAEFFDDYKSFERDWSDKEREYKTPSSNRLYCSNISKKCEAFIGDRTAFIFSIAFCRGCGVWVAVSKEEEVPEDLKDYKRCPEPKCRGLIELQDGCNLVRCQWGNCGMQFCYICLAIRPSPEHFSRGKCPKYGVPGAENALFIEDVLEDEDLEDGEIDENDEDGPIDNVDPDFENSVVTWAINIHRMETLLTGKLEDIPVPMEEAVPTFAVNVSAPQRLLVSADNIRQMLEDPVLVRERQLEIVADHRQLMQANLNVWHVVQEDLRNDGMLDENPNLGAELRDAATSLIPNLELYINPDGVRNAFLDFFNRHQLIMARTEQLMTGQVFHFSPTAYAAFRIYRDVVPAKLAAVAAEIAKANDWAGRVIKENDMDQVMPDRELIKDAMPDDEQAIRLRKEWSLRVHLRLTTLNAVPPSQRAMAETSFVTGPQREIMEDGHANAQALIIIGRDGIVDLLDDLPDLVHHGADEKAALANKFVEAAENLAINLDLYTHFDRIRTRHAEYTQRHDALVEFWNRDMPRATGFFDIEPDVFCAFLLYTLVAADRLAEAAPQ